MAPEEKKPELPVEKESKVSVKKAEKTELEQVLARLAAMEEQRTKDAEKIAMLTSIADKGAMAKFEAKQDKKIVREVFLRTLGGKLIISWRSIMDRVWKDNDDSWHERQTFEVETEDGEKTALDIRAFTNELGRKMAKVLKREQSYVEDKNGVEILTETFTLQVEGREEPIVLKGNFVN